MPRVLFWNVRRQQLDALVLSMVAGQGLDVVVLLESPPRSRLPTLLAPLGWQRVSRSDRFTVAARQDIRFTRQPNPDVTDRVEFWRVEPAGRDDWLFALVHGPDRRNAPQDDTRRFLFRRVRETIRFLERCLGHRRTVVLGDLNANPYEPSVLGADGLHAIGARRVRSRTDRAVRTAGRSDFFYNPMWRLYGSDPAGDAGAASYYYHGYEPTEPFWHMLDQVLIRPECADRMPPGELRLVTAAAATRLTDADGLPDAGAGSDHLPVTFLLR